MLAQKQPPLYKLVDIANDPVPGFFYNEELTKSAPLDFGKNYFMVEKVLKTKFIKGVKYSLVKYLFYGNKVKNYRILWWNFAHFYLPTTHYVSSVIWQHWFYT